MAQEELDGDDLAVNLSWPTGPDAVRRKGGAPAPTTRPSTWSAPPAEPGLRPTPLEPRPAAPARRAEVPRSAPAGASTPRSPARNPRSAAPVPRPAPRATAQARPAPPSAARLPGPLDQRRTARAPSGPPPSDQFRRPTAGPGRPPEASPQRRAQPAPAPARRPADGASSGGGSKQTLLDLVEHLNTLSELVTGASRASSAEISALGDQVERAVADLDSLQLRVVRSLAGFDAVRMRVETELANRPPLTDDDVDRIADAVTLRLLENVRVEVER